jgi:three-Cys-motif partner protein
VSASDVLWEREEHTEAKHRLVVGYLHAWFPIMADRNRALNIIDGFAGPGRYIGGEPGSPLLMLEAFTQHRNRTAKMDAATISYDFIEVRADRANHLRAEIERLSLPANVQVAVHTGEFDEVMGRILDELPPTYGLAPTFAFVDPFGYTGHSLQLSSRILQFRGCEVFIYIPWPFIARFINTPAVEGALTTLFSDESWKAARGLSGHDAARTLHEIFLGKVRRAAGYAVSFEIDAAQGRGWAGYTLYFGTGNTLGLERMKEAMWRVDPAGGVRFAYSNDPRQMTIFDAAPDLRHAGGRATREIWSAPVHDRASGAGHGAGDTLCTAHPSEDSLPRGRGARSAS